MEKHPIIKESLTTKEVCEMLEVSRATLYRARKEGILKPVRLGRFLRFKRTEIDAFIEKLREQAAV